MICGICSEPATHYFATVAKGNAMRCQHHADQFGYPQYLVEINPPKPALRVPGYIIQSFAGDGEIDEVSEIWPFEEELSEWWVKNLSGADDRSVEWLVGDAAYEPYSAKQLDAADLRVEVTRVTCLAMV